MCPLFLLIIFLFQGVPYFFCPFDQNVKIIQTITKMVQNIYPLHLVPWKALRHNPKCKKIFIVMRKNFIVSFHREKFVPANDQVFQSHQHSSEYNITLWFLVKSLYELLKQAPKQWHEKIDHAVMSHVFTYKSVDRCIYPKFTKDYGIIVCL